MQNKKKKIITNQEEAEMKRTLIVALIMAVVMMCGTPVFAKNVAGIKLDAPDLIKISDDVTIGIEGGKDVMTDIFYPDTFDYVEADKGYFGYVKVTVKWTLLDFSKK